MCTKPRIIVSQALYQVTSRGIPEMDVFPNRELKAFFLKELAITLKKFSFTCYSWSIMNDHYHLVLKSSDISISKFMRRLNSIYAKHFNKENGRSGVVFLRRFASVIAKEKSGFKELVRYVHLNPVRCGSCTVEELDRYEWSGYGAIVQNSPDDIQDKRAVLEHFSGLNPARAYREFVTTQLADWEKNEVIIKVRNENRSVPNFSVPELRVIGDPLFIEMVLGKDRCRRARVARYISGSITAEQLQKRVCACMGLNEKDLFCRGRLNSRSTGRKLFAFTGTSRLDFSGMDLARHLGVTGSAVSRMISRSAAVEDRNLSADTICQDLWKVEYITV